MKILHLADVHLDRPFAALPHEAARARRRELLDALGRCLALARERSADLVTIGGDLWEHEHVTADTRRTVARLLGDLGLPVLVICGNHDPYTPGGPYARTDWPANVRVFDASVPAEHVHEDVSVWGVSWTGGPLDPGLLRRFRAPDDGRTHLLLLHGTRHGAAFFAEDGGHCPFLASEIADAGFAACLAGHVHAGSWQDGVVYPGSPEPLDRSKQGLHGVALVEVRNGAVEVELIPVNRRRYVTREVSVDGAESGAEAAEAIAGALAGADDERAFLTVRLTGEVAPGCAIDPAAIVREHEARFAHVEVVDATATAPDPALVAVGGTAASIFVRRLQERIGAAADDAERERLRLALDAGLRALAGRKDVLRVG